MSFYVLYSITEVAEPYLCPTEIVKQQNSENNQQGENVYQESKVTNGGSDAMNHAMDNVSDNDDH